MKFVIIAMSRTGSYMLSSALNAHPEVICFGELVKKNPLFEIDYLELSQTEGPTRELIENRVEQPVPLLQHAYEFGASLVSRVGFKLMLGQNRLALDFILNDANIKKIVLQRNNLLASFASQEVARASGQGVVEKGQKVRDLKVEFSPKSFDQFCRRRARLYDELWLQLGPEQTESTCRIDYLEAATQEGVERVLNYLGLEIVASAIPGTQRRSDGQALDRFTNPGQVVEHLTQLGRTHWLEPEYI